MAAIGGHWLAALALAGLLCGVSGQSPPSPSPTPPSPTPGSSPSPPPSGNGTAQFAPSSLPPNANLNPCYCSPPASDGSYACFNFNAATSDVNCKPSGTCVAATAAPGEYNIQAGGPIYKCGPEKPSTPADRDTPCSPDLQENLGSRQGDLGAGTVYLFRCRGQDIVFCTPRANTGYTIIGRTQQGAYQICAPVVTTSKTAVGVVTQPDGSSHAQCSTSKDCASAREACYYNSGGMCELLVPPSALGP